MNKKITNISGPVSLYVFFVNNKKYFFFGDIHFSNAGSCESNNIKCDHYDNKFKDVKLYNTNCTDFGALLHNWFTYNNEHDIKTDFYLEIPYTKSDLRHGTVHFNTLIEDKTDYFPYTEESWISLVADIMNPCFIRDKTGCQYYPNVHAHYTDIRTTETLEGFFFHDLFNLHYISEYIYDNIDTMNDIMFSNMKAEFLEYLVILLTNYDTIFQLLIDFDHYQTHMPELIKLGNDLQIPEIKEIYISILDNMDEMTVIRNVMEHQNVKMHRIASEIIKFYNKNPDLAKNLYQFTKEKAHKIIDFLIHDVELSLDQDYNKKEFLTIIADYNDKFIVLTSLHMDVYTLSRMFTQDGTDVITYTGSYHTENYVDFFKQFITNPNLSIPTSNKLNNLRCLYHQSLPNYIDALKYKNYMYYRKRAIFILDNVNKDKPYVIQQYGQWYNITIVKNKYPLFKELYNIHYILKNKQEITSWDKLKTMQLIIKYLQSVNQ
jgi:3-methyladenine DNA glycosylase AlkC